MHKATCAFCPQAGALSPSQIKAFESGCQRKWAFRHILNIAEPSFGFQELGKEVHQHLESYLKHGARPPNTKAGQIALSGLDDLPKPTQHHLVEQHVYLEREGIAFHGFADLIPHAEYAIDDHKTTVDFKYALTQAELKRDPQALIYGMWLAEKQPLAYREKCDLMLRWRYYRTRKPFKAMTVTATLSWQELQRNFSRWVLEPARKMRHIRISATDAFDPNELPGNTGSCDAYGGCPYKGRCSFHQTGKLTMGSLFRDKLQARQTPPAAAPSKDVATICGECDAVIDAEGNCECVVIVGRGVVPPDAPQPVRELPEVEPRRNGSKRGRPKGKKNVPKLEQEVAVMQAPFTMDDELGNAPIGDLVLCINAFPAKGRVMLLSEALRPIVDKLSNELGVTHYRLAKEAEYGRADALLLSAFKQAAPKLTGYVYVDKRDVDSAAILGHLEAAATEIFRGVY